LRTHLRFTIGLILATAGLASLGFAHAQSTNDSLRIYAVIIHDPPQPWTGYGIYLGRGLVITANVIARALKRSNLAISDRLKPAYNQLSLPLPNESRWRLICAKAATPYSAFSH
jgi:hypothetical protein